MGGHKALAASDEREELRFLPVVDWHVAVAQKEDAVHVAQARTATGRRAVSLLRLVEDDVGVGADERVPKPCLVTKALDDGERVRREGVL